MAKKIGKIILIVYLTLATVASALFGYLYFSKSVEGSQDEMNISIKGLMSILSTDIENLINKRETSGLSSTTGKEISTYDSEARKSRLGLPFSEYAEMDTNKGGYTYIGNSQGVLGNYKGVIDFVNSEAVEKLTANGKVLNCIMDLYTFKETTEGLGVWVSLAAEYKEGHLYVYFRINHDNIPDDSHVEYLTISLLYDITLNETRDDYTEVYVYGGPRESIMNGERMHWNGTTTHYFCKENSELVSGYEIGYPGDEQKMDYHKDAIPDNYVKNFMIGEFDFKENLSFYGSWSSENPEEGVIAKYKDVKDKLYQVQLFTYRNVIKLLDEKLGANKFDKNNKLIFS